MFRDEFHVRIASQAGAFISTLPVGCTSERAGRPGRAFPVKEGIDRVNAGESALGVFPVRACFYGLEDDALAGFAFHDHMERCIEAQMADASVVFHGILTGEPVPIYRAFPRIRIHREVADLKRGEVLEEMTALRGRDTKVAETCLNDQARPGNLIPVHGYSQPGIVRPPAAHSDQKIRPVAGVQYAVEVSDGFSDFVAPAAFEALRIDDDNVIQILDATIAEDFAALAKQPFRLNVVER